MIDHYKIQGPAIVAFSGGSSSGFMLWNILQAHGGTLPEDVVPVFANTGLEHPKTYDFVQTCEENWKVKIRWVEFAGNKTWKEVDYKTASRKGEPFELLIDERQFLPNPLTRFCTVELKIRSMDRYAIHHLGWAHGHTEVVGLRKDEPRRALRIKPNKAANDVLCPMYLAGHTLDDVEAFWFKHPFKLEIPQMWGNCVGCFLKSGAKLAAIAEANKADLEWWARQEDKAMAWRLQGKATSGKFREDRPSYRGLIQMAEEQKTFCFPEDDTLPCACTD